MREESGTSSHFVVRREPIQVSFILNFGRCGLSHRGAGPTESRKDWTCAFIPSSSLSPYRSAVSLLKRPLLRRNIRERLNNAWPARPTSCGCAAARFRIPTGSWRVCGKIRSSSAGAAARCLNRTTACRSRRHSRSCRDAARSDRALRSSIAGSAATPAPGTHRPIRRRPVPPSASARCARRC